MLTSRIPAPVGGMTLTRVTREEGIVLLHLRGHCHDSSICRFCKVEQWGAAQALEAQRNERALDSIISG